MVKVNLEKTLIESKEKHTQQIESADVVKEVKLLLAGDEAEDMRIMQGLGKFHSTARVNEEYGKQLELENLDKQFAGKVFHINQIRDLAIEYNLRFLPTTQYSGKIDIQAISKIKEFAKATNTNISEATLERKFFILAPESQFKLVKEVRFNPKPADPIMFYKIDEEHFKMLHKWGKDFTVARLISGYKWKSFGRHFLFQMAVGFILSNLLFGFILSKGFLATYPTATTIITIAGAIVFAVAMGVRFWSDNGADPDCFSPNKWNSDVHVRRG